MCNVDLETGELPFKYKIVNVLAALLGFSLVRLV